MVNREVDSDVITDPPKKIQSNQFLIETGLTACANKGLQAFFNMANGVGQSPAVEPVYDLIELEVRNVNIEREQRRVAGHVYGGSSSSTVDVVGSTEVLTELTDVQRESVEMPEVYSVLMSWTEVFGGGVRPMHKGWRPGARPHDSYHDSYQYAAQQAIGRLSRAELARQLRGNIKQPLLGKYSTGDFWTWIYLEPPPISGAFEIKPRLPFVFTAGSRNIVISNMNTIGIAKHASALGSGVLTLPMRNWVHDKMKEIAERNSLMTDPDALSHGEYNKFFFKTYVDHVLKHGYTDVQEDRDNDDLHVLAWRGSDAQESDKPHLVYVTHFVVQTCKKPPVEIISSDTDGSKDFFNLTAHEVIQDLQKMAENEGKHPDADVEAIYQKIDDGQESTVTTTFSGKTETVAEVSNIHPNMREKKSIFWFAYNMLSALCGMKGTEAAKIKIGTDYVKCNKKYILSNIVSGSTRHDRLDVVSDMLSDYSEMIRKNISAHGFDLNGFQLESSSYKDGILNMIHDIRAFSHCHKFKQHIGKYVEEVQGVSDGLNIGHWGENERAEEYSKDNIRRILRMRASYYFKTKVGYTYTPKYWEHTDLGFVCRLIENMSASWYAENSEGKKPFVIWDSDEGEYSTHDFSLVGMVYNSMLRSNSNGIDTYSMYFDTANRDDNNGRDESVRKEEVCGTLSDLDDSDPDDIEAGKDPCDPNVDTTGGNINNFAELVETHRKIALKAAQFEDRQRAINVQKRFLVSCESSENRWDIGSGWHFDDDARRRRSRPLAAKIGKIFASAYLDMRQQFDATAIEPNTEYYSRHPESNLGIEPVWQRLNLTRYFVTYYNTAKIPLDPARLSRDTIQPSGYPYMSFPGQSYVPPTMLDSSSGKSQERWGKSGIHYRSYPRTICRKTEINSFMVEDTPGDRDPSFCNLHFGQVFPRKQVRPAFLTFARNKVTMTLAEMKANYVSKKGGRSSVPLASDRDPNDPDWCHEGTMKPRLTEINEPYHTRKFQGGDIYVEREISMRSFKKCLCDQDVGISYRN